MHNALSSPVNVVSMCACTISFLSNISPILQLTVLISKFLQKLFRDNPIQIETIYDLPMMLKIKFLITKIARMEGSENSE